MSWSDASCSSGFGWYVIGVLYPDRGRGMQLRVQPDNSLSEIPLFRLVWGRRRIGTTGYTTVVETDAFDSFVALSDPLLVVATVRSGREIGGCLVGFHAQASIDPPLYAVWLSRENRTTRLARDAEYLALHHLDVEQLDIAERFGSTTGDDHDKFAAAAWIEGQHRLPFLTECPNRLVLNRLSVIDVAASDHLCWLGRVEGAHASRTRAGSLRLSGGQHLEAGHDA